jgi:tetratricopeptide (TPR) repeat protein
MAVCLLQFNCAALSAAEVSGASPNRDAVSANLHFNRALDYQLGGNSEAAVSEYRKGLELNPDSVDGHSRLGVLLLEEQGDLDGAVSEFVTALGIDPEATFCQQRLDETVEKMNSTAPGNISRGNDFYRDGQLTRASAAYRIAVYVDPQNAEARNSLAWTLYRLGKLDEGLKEVKLALTLKSDEPEYINTLACILFDQGNLEGAMANWQKAIAKSKKANPADLYGLAIGFLSKGDTDLAIAKFKEALKFDPNYRDAAYLRDKIGMSAHALAAHEKLVSLAGMTKD